MGRPQLCYEDVHVADMIPPLVKNTSAADLARYAAAAADPSPIHLDPAYARTRGMKGVILHGLFKAACLGQMLTDWAGPQGWVKKFGTKYQRINMPGDPMTCRGKVVQMRVEGEFHLVDVELWTENSQGDVTTTGQATVLLPSRTTTAARR